MLHSNIKEHKFIKQYCADCGYFKTVSMYCGDRLCEECKERNFYRLLNHYSPVIKKIPGYKCSQITLTWRNVKKLSPEYVDTIQEDYRKLRRSKLWKDYVKGALATIECKHVDDIKGWNVHVHVLAHCSYIPQRKLSEVWEFISGASIVDIRREENSVRAVYHLLKYMNKNAIIQGRDVEDLKKQFNYAFKGRRFVITTGNFYGLSDNELYRYVCPVCGCKNWITEHGLSSLESHAKQKGREPPGDINLTCIISDKLHLPLA